MIRSMLLVTVSGLLAVGCAPARAPQAAAPPAAAAWVPAGEPVTCVQTNRIRESRVLDDSTILFVMTDGTVFRNDLPNRCPGLGFERAFSYQTSISQLCNVNIITVINQGGGPRSGASCGLGLFTPVRSAGEAAG